MADSSESSKSAKLKFGVDRLLSPEVPKLPGVHIGGILAPRATVAVPCSDCVSSLLRCCRLGPGHNEPIHPGYSYAPIHQPQPVRPFATRPSTYNQCPMNFISLDEL